MIIGRTYGLTLEQDIETKERSVYLNFADENGNIVAKCKMAKSFAKNFIDDIQKAYYAAVTHNESLEHG